jgi:hypothetical protein
MDCVKYANVEEGPGYEMESYVNDRLGISVLDLLLLIDQGVLYLNGHTSQK